VALQEGLAIVPQLREARWSLAQLDVAAWVEPADDQPSDYAAAFAAIAKARAGRAEDDPGTALAEAVVRYRHGVVAAATALFERVLPRYPVGEDTTQMAEACRRYPEAMSVELGYRRRDEAANLPRARMETSKGPVVFELFEDDAPNSVANFVWLADAKFYDGLAFHRVVPFFMAQGGDPASRTGYAIPTEPSRRLPVRGVLAYAHAKRDGEGSQFFVTTGTSANLQGDFSVFGRVVEGQDVVDRLVRGDRIVTLAVVARRDHPYRPTTVAGTPAPAPVATFPPPPK
jgi:cyclophilin family peptidyl-prolyl cis-trans isomerase